MQPEEVYAKFKNGREVAFSNPTVEFDGQWLIVHDAVASNYQVPTALPIPNMATLRVSMGPRLTRRTPRR